MSVAPPPGWPVAFRRSAAIAAGVVTAKVLRRGHRIIEVPVSFVARTFEEGKKIGYRDFFVAMRILFKHRFRE